MGDFLAGAGAEAGAGAGAGPGPGAGRRVVLVSGAPGAGKSTLAGPLAAGLGFALLGKDLIKETLHDALGAPAADRPWSRRLGGAAMELIWALAADAPAVVLEANFRPHSEYERGRITGLGGRIVEVDCSCPVRLATARYNGRAATRHRGARGGHHVGGTSGRVRPADRAGGTGRDRYLGSGSTSPGW